MKYEFHAEYPFATKDSVTQGFALQWLAGELERLPHRWPDIATITDPAARLNILAQAILTGHQDRARSGTHRKSGGYKFWIERHAAQFLEEQKRQLAALDLLPSLPDLTLFPAGAWAVRVSFTLRKPYLSKDDQALHLLDNPVKKEWVFKAPYVAPSQWKGALRAAMMQELVAWWLGLEEKRGEREYRKIFIRRRLQLVRLFGTEKGVLLDDQRFESYLDRLGDPELARWFRRVLRRYCSSAGFVAGRLHFFPTFFDRIGLEVINPHDRETGAGARGPMLMECVPQAATGEFVLLYVPFGPFDQEEAQKCAEIAQDMEALAKGVQAMLTTYGFGAKTSSGFGVAEVDSWKVYPQEKEAEWYRGWEQAG